MTEQKAWEAAFERLDAVTSKLFRTIGEEQPHIAMAALLGIANTIAISPLLSEEQKKRATSFMLIAALDAARINGMTREEILFVIDETTSHWKIQ